MPGHKQQPKPNLCFPLPGRRGRGRGTRTSRTRTPSGSKRRSVDEEDRGSEESGSEFAQPIHPARRRKTNTKPKPKLSFSDDEDSDIDLFEVENKAAGKTQAHGAGRTRIGHFNLRANF